MKKDEILAERVRRALEDVPNVQEKRMFGSVAFMVNHKMCINVGHGRLMCRIDPELHEAAIMRKGVRTVTMKKRKYVGYVFVAAKVVSTGASLRYWVNHCLEFNERAKASKRRIRKSGNAK